jgi:ribosome-associated protein
LLSSAVVRKPVSPNSCLPLLKLCYCREIDTTNTSLKRELMVDNLAADESGLTKSKSQVKREMLALQDLGARLTRLHAPVLARLDLPEELRAALQEYARLRANGAKRRQLQFIGALMRQVDAASIEQQLHALEHAHRRQVAGLQRIEAWRDRLVHGDQATLTELFDCYPQLDRQQLRQLARKAQQEAQNASGNAASHALFRYLQAHLPTDVAGETDADQAIRIGSA